MHAGSRSLISLTSAPGTAGATAYGYIWKEEAAMEPVGALVPRQWWLVRFPAGEVIQEEGDTMGPGSFRAAYGYSMVISPIDQLVRMVR